MVSAPPKSLKERPWARYRHMPFPSALGPFPYKLLIPGWGGHLDHDELAFIVEHLKEDASLRLWWGMKSSWRRIPEQTVRRVAMEGSEDDQALTAD